MQTNTSYTDRTHFLGALLRRQAEVSMGDDTGHTSNGIAYQLGYLIGVIAGKPELYELAIEELASLGVRDPG